MQALRFHRIVKKDGEISMHGLPCKKGQNVEMIILIESSFEDKNSSLTPKKLIQSKMVGLWKGRKDIGRSAVYARQLREKAQRRWG